MSKNFPLVSVLINNYNKEHFCEEAINSALKQSYKNIEFWKEKVSHTWENEDIPIEIVGNKYDGFFRFVFKDTHLISAKDNTNILHSNILHSN